MLAMQLAAGVTAELAHEHEAAGRQASDRDGSSLGLTGAGASLTSASGDDHEHDCAACRLLAQLSHGIARPAALGFATRVMRLHAATPSAPLGGSLLAPHSRGPPRLV